MKRYPNVQKADFINSEQCLSVSDPDDDDYCSLCNSWYRPPHENDDSPIGGDSDSYSGIDDGTLISASKIDHFSYEQSLP